MPKRGKIFKPLAIFALGSLAGTVAALLFAPRSGQETRAQIKSKGVRLVDKVKTARKPQDPNVRKISNWGNYPQVNVEFHEFEDIETLRELVLQSEKVIARGNGRCYGDSALAPQVISSLKYNKFLSFDQANGVIHCQSGVLLSDILDVIVPRGWFLPVTPGTKLITVGGAIASNVHGKSQHKAGNFSDHVLEMELMLSDGRLVTCSPTENADLYWSTSGGMGLTGVIVNAKLRLIPIETAYIRQESIKAENLDHLMDLFEQSEAWTYSVAWIDCMATGKNLGRGFIMRGEHAKLSELQKEAHRQNPLSLKPARKINVPINFPSFTLNKFSLKAFNMALYHKHPNKPAKTIVDYDTFFYPLDSILNWNKIYGKRGFTQYQFILPKSTSRAGLTKILDKMAENGKGSFLAVLKLYRQQTGYLPFAIDGYALALDFPIEDDLFEFLEELDQIVLEYGGRLYLTKDVRMDKSMFTQSYPELDQFIKVIKDLNHDHKFSSFQSDRVGITQ